MSKEKWIKAGGKKICYIQCTVCGIDVYQCDNCHERLIDDDEQVECYCSHGTSDMSHLCPACYQYMVEDGRIKKGHEHE